MPNNNRLQLVWAGLARNNRWSSYICQKDVDTFNRRMEGEGSEFYARGLGAFRTAFLTGLGKGQWEGAHGFGTKRKSVLPRFLYKATSRVFTDEGVMRYDIDVDAVACVNQLTAVFTKICGGHTPQSEQTVIESFVKTEKDMAECSIDYARLVKTYRNEGHDAVISSWTPLETVMTKASRLVRRVLAGADPREISPKHGSGVSACGTKVRDRYAAPRFVDKIDKIWPMSEYYYASPTAFCDGLDEYMQAPELDPCAKVLLVPKDARGPRLISCEPRETMWIQQGLMGLIYDTIEEHYLTRGRVNFTDQRFNQRASFYGSLRPNVAGRRAGTFAMSLPIPGSNGETAEAVDPDMHEYDFVTYQDLARRGYRFNIEPSTEEWDWQDKLSVRLAQTEMYLRGRDLHLDPRTPVAGKLATLDLKDASDKLRLDVVQRLFPPNWSDALTAARSSKTELPDGRVVDLVKHAPMGSACCFPVMALVIWSVLTAIAPKGAARHILVYGDDIVVPAFMTQAATEVLEAIGFTVNRDKSFSQGPFRESCGEEFVLGCRVTPVRLRHNLDDDAESLLAAMAFSNNLLDSPTLADSGWFIELLKEWYGAHNVPVLLRMRKKHVTWLSQAQLLQVGENFRDVTLSGVAFTDDPQSVSLPDGKDTKVHGVKSRANMPAYFRKMHRILVPVPRLEKYETGDWCHVLRSLLNKSDTGLGLDVVHNRIRFKRQWRFLD